MTQVFTVLASGTEVGKTYASCAILTAARKRGHKVHAIKPVMSGFDEAAIGNSDAGKLQQAIGGAPLDTINLHRFSPALAPNIAARKAGTTTRFTALYQFCQTHIKGDLCLVEGAGGVLSPLTDDASNADLALALKRPALIVTTNYLGSVTHTLTALEACENRGIAVAGIIVSQTRTNALSPDALIEELKRLCRVPLFPLRHAGRGDAILDHLLADQAPIRSKTGE